MKILIFVLISMNGYTEKGKGLGVPDSFPLYVITKVLAFSSQKIQFWGIGLCVAKKMAKITLKR